MSDDFSEHLAIAVGAMLLLVGVGALIFLVYLVVRVLVREFRDDIDRIRTDKLRFQLSLKDILVLVLAASVALAIPRAVTDPSDPAFVRLMPGGVLFYFFLCFWVARRLRRGRDSADAISPEPAPPPTQT